MENRKEMNGSMLYGISCNVYVYASARTYIKKHMHNTQIDDKWL